MSIFPQRTPRPTQTPEDTTPATLHTPSGTFSFSLSHTPCVPTQLALYTHPRTHPHTPGHQHLSDRQCILEHCHSFLAWEGEMVLAAPGSRRELCLSRSSLRAVAPLPRPPQVSPKGSPCTHARVPSTVSPPVLFCCGNWGSGACMKDWSLTRVCVYMYLRPPCPFLSLQVGLCGPC